MEDDVAASERFKESFGEVCSVMQNFQLAAWEAGIGMTWSSSEVIYNEGFSNGMGVKAGERIVGILHLGYIAKIPKGRSRTPSEKKMTYLNAR